MDLETNDNNISAQRYVDQLLDEGAKTPCDNTNDTFVKQGDSMPPYFDRALFKTSIEDVVNLKGWSSMKIHSFLIWKAFKNVYFLHQNVKARLFRRGQKLFLKHIYAMNVMHALGIVLLYVVPSAFNVVISAAKAGAGVFDVYCRQARTNKNIQSFYYSDFGPGSSEWKGISKIKLRHNSVSKGSIRQGFNALTQKEMVLAQFVFIGLNLVRGEMAGMHGVTEEEWKGLHHFWRVIGYLIGIEERFNICSVPVAKTRQISELLIKQVFKPAMDRKDPEFLKVAKLSCLCWQPILADLEAQCAMNHVYNLLQPREMTGILEPTYLEMNWFLRLYYKYYVFSVMYLLRWDVYRILRNAFHKLNLHLITTYSIVPKFQCAIFDYIH